MGNKKQSAYYTSMRIKLRIRDKKALKYYLNNCIY